MVSPHHATPHRPVDRSIATHKQHAASNRYNHNELMLSIRVICETHQNHLVSKIESLRLLLDTKQTHPLRETDGVKRLGE